MKRPRTRTSSSRVAPASSARAAVTSACGTVCPRSLVLAFHARPLPPCVRSVCRPRPPPSGRRARSAPRRRPPTGRAAGRPPCSAACGAGSAARSGSPRGGSSASAPCPRWSRAAPAFFDARLRQLRHGAQQPFGVRVLRAREQLFDRRLFDDAARVHDGDAVGDFGDDAEVVRDEEHGEVARPPQLVDQLKNLRLNGHVERGRRLVGDEQPRVARERHRDHHALPHPARELVRVVVRAARRGRGSTPRASPRPPPRAPAYDSSSGGASAPPRSARRPCRRG